MEKKSVSLREITMHDADIIVKWRSDPTVYKYFLNPHPITKEEHLNWYYNFYLNDRNRTDFILETKDNKDSIGVFGARKAGKNIVEISYLLDKHWQGKGYAQEGIKLLIEFINANWKAEKIVAEIHCENKSSIALVNRLCFVNTASNGDFLIFERTL